ncbi:MAG: hypothetical protein US67_C0069G0005 [Candidatus Woesebacteria bacterium GW2011_GWD1_38_10]|uniref:Uncharacterized protein n=1 Tax=Candidatus Woesebacteria bacterium GW2011_GWD1_38_10 TaxID=1618592 RepID=A0A0G0I6Z5_9BACT|nr:MAG: hypothetical protein US67_C0069G0005 [Candidatus Woesebacteria bacterium GW2011_GWD1_38_10]
MKKLAFGIASLALILSATVALAANNQSLDYVEAEDLAETNGWGLAVSDITSSTTAYGGILTSGDAGMVTTLGYDGAAEYTFTWEQGAAQTLVIRHLDGFADDSFVVDAYRDPGYGQGKSNNDQEWWVKVGEYNDQYSTEEWITSEFDLTGYGHWAKGTGEMKVKITRTGANWSGYEIWGQLAIDWMELKGNTNNSAR